MQPGLKEDRPRLEPVGVTRQGLCQVLVRYMISRMDWEEISKSSSGRMQSRNGVHKRCCDVGVPEGEDLVGRQEVYPLGFGLVA